jgi:hypothetical protein
MWQPFFVAGRKEEIRVIGVIGVIGAISVIGSE